VTSKNYLSTELFLKLETVKSKSLVFANEYVAMNYKTSPAHTAHHTRRVHCLVKMYISLRDLRYCAYFNLFRFKKSKDFNGFFFRGHFKKNQKWYAVFITVCLGICSKNLGLLTRLWVIWVKLTQGTRRRICGWNKHFLLILNYTMSNFFEVNQVNSALSLNNSNALQAYLISGTFYEFAVGSFQTLPFFWVWLASIVVWFFLELSSYLSYSFNLKHSYLNNINRLSVTGVYLVRLLNNKLKLSLFIEKAYKYFL